MAPGPGCQLSVQDTKGVSRVFQWVSSVFLCFFYGFLGFFYGCKLEVFFVFPFKNAFLVGFASGVWPCSFCSLGFCTFRLSLLGSTIRHHGAVCLKALPKALMVHFLQGRCCRL